MQNYGARWLQILALMTVGVAAAADTPTPSREDRDKADTALKTKETEFKRKTTAVDDGTKLRLNLSKSIEALEKTYTPFAKEVEEMTALAKKRADDAAQANDRDAVKAATILQERATAMEAEIAKMRDTLANLKAIQKKAEEESDLGQREINRLKLEVQKALLTYFKTADPAMISQRYGIQLDRNFSFDSAEFMKVTGGGDPKNWLARYGLGAERPWDDRFTYVDEKGWHTITLKGVAQHEQVTTRDMYDMATRLLQQKIPGMRAPVGRYGLMVNEGDRKGNPEAFKGVYGHPVDAFRPSVINNSTGAWTALNREDVFRELMDYYTRGDDAVTYKAENGSITYGLPPIGRPIVGNASGNSGWGFVPDTTAIQNFYPTHMNIGTVTIPLAKDSNKRDDKAPHEVEYYSSSNTGVHALIQRPRYNTDGTEIKFQYLNPKFEEILEDNLWRLAGKPGIPTAEDLTDEKKYPPELVAAVKHDKEIFLKVIREREGVDEKGFTPDLRGTSFAAPTANGVILAARELYPTASESEIIDAFCSACVPILNRRTVDEMGRPKDLVSDVPYIINKKNGYCYSPMVGFGEFVMDENRSKEHPDSWMRMLDRLEAMQQARKKLPNATVEVGNGPDKRTVANNGQPSFVTLELTKAKEVVPEAAKKLTEELQAEVMVAFKAARSAYNLPAMKDSDPIMKHLNSRQYREALDLLKKEVEEASKGGILDLFPKLPGVLDAGFMVGGVKQLSMKQAEAAVEKTEKMSQHTYQFNVYDTQDICCTMAALRLHFKDMNRTDDFVVLESPDGTRIPIIMGSSHDWQGTPTGVAVSSTPGFMRKSAAGTWKLYTRQELDLEGTELVLSGTERNSKLTDVRMILSDIEQKEAKKRTDIPAANLVNIADPHQYLREWSGVEGSGKQLKRRKTSTSPSTRQEFQEYLQDLILNSRVIKKMVQEGRMKMTEEGEVEGSIEKVSFNESGLDAGRKALAHMTDRLGSLLAAASTVTADLPDPRGVREAWGYLASSIVPPQDAEKGKAPAARKKDNAAPQGVGYLALLKSRKDDVPPWWHDNQVAQVEESRRPQRMGGRKA